MRKLGDLHRQTTQGEGHGNSKLLTNTGQAWVGVGGQRTTPFHPPRDAHILASEPVITLAFMAKGIKAADAVRFADLEVNLDYLSGIHLIT